MIVQFAMREIGAIRARQLNLPKGDALTMSMNAREILAELQTLSSIEPAGALPRLRELVGAIEQAIAAEDRNCQAGLAMALAHHALTYLYEGVKIKQNEPEIKRRFAVARRRAEGWAIASAQARLDDPRLSGRKETTFQGLAKIGPTISNCS